MDKETLLENMIAKAYKRELNATADRAHWGIPTLVRVEKELLPYVLQNIRGLIAKRGSNRPLKTTLIGAQLNVRDTTFTSMLEDFEKKLSVSEDEIFLIPHLDLLTASDSGLTGVTKLFIQVMSSYPGTVVIGFFDPNFNIHPSLEEFFSAKVEICGIHRNAFRDCLLSQPEKDFFGKCGLTSNTLFKYTSGLNPVSFRRIISSLWYDRASYFSGPQTRERILSRIRQFTVSKGFEIPDIWMDKHIGGYSAVKGLIKENILSILKGIENIKDPEIIKKVEGIIPKGIIFHGPPGTGKTMFAKAIATEINASIQVISGPEIKSRWFGSSEEKLRKIFFWARKNAPAVIVFDELDAIAPPRTEADDGGTRAEHSIVNQLLTELDGFRSDELVIFIGTTNYLEGIDPALLRPGRVELKIEVGYPNEESRLAILEIYNKTYQLNLSKELKTYIIEKTEGYIDYEEGTRFTGDHIKALTRFLVRERIKTSKSVNRQSVDRFLGLNSKHIILSKEEESVVAIHEAGHAFLAHRLIPDVFVKKVTIVAENEYTLGATESALREHRYQYSKDDLERKIMVLLGGRVAELEFRQELTIGATEDIQRATQIARIMVETCGFSRLGPLDLSDKTQLSETWKHEIDKEVQEIILGAEAKAQQMVRKERDLIQELKNRLMEKKTIHFNEVKEVLDGKNKHTICLR